MKLTFIGSFIQAKTGIERINFELIKRLVEDGEIEKVDLVTSRSRAQISEELLNSGKISVHIFPDSMVKTLALFSLPRFFKIVYKNPVCVIANVRPVAILTYLLYPFFRKKTKIVQIIPDIIAWHYPKLFPGIISFVFKIYGRFFAKFPFLSIVHSEFTKNDIHKSWRVPLEKIKVVNLGSFIKPMLPRENFSGRKILYVGTIEPRKGVDRLLDAFEIVMKEVPNAELILCGKIGWKVEKVVERINKLTQQHLNIKYLGYVDDKKLNDLFREVDVCVYPSIYEGFGLPPLEAMACGCPVIVSNSSSLPEVVGDAGILVDPYDVDGMAKAIIRVLRDDEFKKKMSFLGIERAKKFNLEKQLNEIIKIIKSI